MSPDILLVTLAVESVLLLACLYRELFGPSGPWQAP